MDKNALRETLRARLRAMSAAEKAQKDAAIVAHIVGARLIGGDYLSFDPLPTEPDLRALTAIYPDYRALLPVVAEAEMYFVRTDALTVFRRGAFGIREPIGPPADPATARCCIVPMLGFDGAKNRLGKGKGYYDRFLKGRDLLKIGAAYACQRTDDLLAEAHDVGMDLIVTEEGILR